MMMEYNELEIDGKMVELQIAQLVRTPERKAGDPGSNPITGENFFS